MYDQPTAPLSIGQVLDKGFGLFKASFTSVIGISAAGNLLYIPVNLVSSRALTGPPSGNLTVAYFAATLVFVVISLVVSGAIIARIGGIATGKPIAFGQALRTGLRRGPALFIVSLIYGLLVVIGFLLVVPGIYLMVALAFCFYPVVLENKGSLESLAESRVLVRGSWWRTAGILTVIGIILLCAYLIIGFIASLFFFASPGQSLGGSAGPFVLFLDNVIGPIVNAVFAPLSYAMFMVVYFDLKLRREGTDLAARIEAASS